MFKKLTSEKFSIALVLIGILFILTAVFFFFWKTSIFEVSQPIDGTKVGQFGDVIGGVAGSLFSLAGVLLFYLALKEQRSDFKVNNETLQLQREELILQRKELEETRAVFEKQSKIMTDQQNDSTFFNLLENHRRLVEGFGTMEPKSISPGKSKRGSYTFPTTFNTSVSAHDVISKIVEHWKAYFEAYTESFNEKKILNLDFGDYRNYEDLINSYSEVHILFKELIHIHQYIEARFTESQQEFYKSTLAYSVTQDVQFIFESLFFLYPELTHGVKYHPSFYKHHKYIDFRKCEVPQVTVDSARKYNEGHTYVVKTKADIKAAKMIILWHGSPKNENELIDIVPLVNQADFNPFEYYFSIEDAVEKSNLNTGRLPTEQDMSGNRFSYFFSFKMEVNNISFDLMFTIKVEFRDRAILEGKKVFELSTQNISQLGLSSYKEIDHFIKHPSQKLLVSVSDLHLIESINNKLKYYFKEHKEVQSIQVNQILSDLIKDGRIPKDGKEYEPLIELLKKLEKINRPDLLPYSSTEIIENKKEYFFKRIK